MNNIHGDRLNQDLLEPRGSGYVGDRAPDFCLANDAASQILYLRYGPDGNVFLIDWYDTNQCHRNEIEVHDRDHGRIFKISYEGDEGDRPKGFLLKPGENLQDLSPEQLVELQLHENDWYVRHARRILQERGPNPAIHERLAEIAAGADTDTRRLRGLWALHVTGGLTPERLAKALRDESPYVRGWAIQLTLDGRDLSEDLVPTLTRLAEHDESPVVRLYLASAAQRLPLEERWNLLAALLSHREDASDHNLPLMYWYATEPLAAVDMGRALELVHDAAVPLVRSYTLRRIADMGSEEAVAFLVEALGRADSAERRREFLGAIHEALKGRRRFPMPAPWAAVYAALIETDDREVVTLARALAVTFGDPQAIADMRALLADAANDAASRRGALASLLAIRDPELVLTLQGLVTDREVGREAIRGLAGYSHPNTPKALVFAYPSLGPEAKRDALNTLASRAEYANELLNAIEGGRIARTDLSADVIRQLRNLDDNDLKQRLSEVWGVVRDSAADKQQLMAEYRALLTGRGPEPDIHLGRTVYAKACAQCHVLFGTGGDVGPELTGSNRRDLEYVLSNVIDPSAVMAKDYQPSVIVTSDGRVITGIVKHETPETITVVTANETVLVPRDEIDEMERSETSMMPDNLWQNLTDHEVRSLVAYLAAPAQVPMRATPETAALIFNGQNLAGWVGDDKLWRVENGEIIGDSPGIRRNNFLVSELLLDDFDLTLEVRLVPNNENSGIQFRSVPLPDGEMRGYQADMGAGWWGKLYEESARGLLWDKPGDQHVKKEDWNTYRIRAVGDHIQTWLNGQKCVDLRDPQGDREGVIGLQIHSGGPMEVRFRNFQLTVINKAQE
jgi:putative heme-binding domain-containing protein